MNNSNNRINNNSQNNSNINNNNNNNNNNNSQYNNSKDYNFFAMIYRMRYINRWNLMRNSSKESIAEHSLDVAVIAHALAMINNIYFGGGVNPDKLVVTAMYHDVPEIITGDLPTPVKYFDEDIKNAYKKVEDAAIKKLVFSLPDDMKGIYKDIISGNYISEEEKRLVKAADKISALIKCVEERHMGNDDFIEAEKSTIWLIKELNCREADKFIELFFNAYNLTLDEQSKESEQK